MKKPLIDVENLNKNFTEYPVTIRDKGWVYGVWYCGTSYQKVTLYGQYPPTFLDRALALFPHIPKECILHCPSGQLPSNYGITLDLMVDDLRKPQICGNVLSLPFRDKQFSLILSDPPYSPEDSKKYGVKKPWPMKRAMKEFYRVLEPGGFLGMLHTRYPSFSKDCFLLRGLISVVCGAGRATRMFSIFERMGGTRTKNTEQQGVFGWHIEDGI